VTSTPEIAQAQPLLVTMEMPAHKTLVILLLPEDVCTLASHVTMEIPAQSTLASEQGCARMCLLWEQLLDAARMPQLAELETSAMTSLASKLSASALLWEDQRPRRVPRI